MGTLRNYLLPAIVACICSVVTVSAYSAVEYPMLDIQTTNGDGGMSSDGSILSIDASVIALILNDQSDFLPLTGPVSITAEFDSQSAFTYNFINGALVVGDQGDELLTATFNEFSVSYAGAGYGVFEADLTYTGGSLYEPLLVGRLEGAVQGLSDSNLAGAFSSSSIIMKVGEVTPVPVPAAVWLFGCGLLTLCGLKQSKASLKKTA